MDRRVDIVEFSQGLNLLGLQLSKVHRRHIVQETSHARHSYWFLRACVYGWCRLTPNESLPTLTATAEAKYSSTSFVSGSLKITGTSSKQLTTGTAHTPYDFAALCLR